MYGHVMALRRIATPHDLGAAVRDARTAAQLTQVELAERAGVSREWLIGLERGARPRAELTKILVVLAALDQPLMLGREEAAEAPEKDEEPARDGEPMTTAEVTRRAIEQSWPTTLRAARGPGSGWSTPSGSWTSPIKGRGSSSRWEPMGVIRTRTWRSGRTCSDSAGTSPPSRAATR